MREVWEGVAQKAKDRVNRNDRLFKLLTTMPGSSPKAWKEMITILEDRPEMVFYKSVREIAATDLQADENLTLFKTGALFALSSAFLADNDTEWAKALIEDLHSKCKGDDWHAD